MSKFYSWLTYKIANTDYAKLVWSYLIFALVFQAFEFARPGDFKIFYQASEALFNHEDIYEIRYGKGFRYYYSPFFGLIIHPLTMFSVHIASTLWNLLNFAILARIFWLIGHYFFAQAKMDSRLLIILTFLAMMFPLYANFHGKQMTVFMLFSILESIYRINKNSGSILGTGLLALAINIKILPIIFIPYLIYRNNFRASFMVVGFSILFLLIPILFLGVQRNNELHGQWMNRINPMENQFHFEINEPGLHSLTTFIPAYFSERISKYELKKVRRHIVSVSDNSIKLIINAIRVFLVLLSLYFLRSFPFRPELNRIKQFWEISYLCLFIPLAFPHQQTYAFVLLFPAMTYLIYYLNVRNFPKPIT